MKKHKRVIVIVVALVLVIGLIMPGVVMFYHIQLIDKAIEETKACSKEKDILCTLSISDGNLVIVTPFEDIAKYKVYMIKEQEDSYIAYWSGHAMTMPVEGYICDRLTFKCGFYICTVWIDQSGKVQKYIKLGI